MPRVKWSQTPEFYTFPAKDPDAKLQYSINWIDFLGGAGGDTITDSEWIDVSDGITESDPTNDATSTSIWLEAGTDGETAQITNRITTAAGSIQDLTFKVPIAHT